MKNIKKWCVLLFLLILPAVPAYAADNIPVYGYTVIRPYPHDNTAFTQGLVYRDGFLYEGTGLNGRSTIRKVDLQTGKIIKMRALENKYFGEGITFFGNKIAQLTEYGNMGFIYDADSFELIGTFGYPTDGWGITYDGKNLIISDGSSVLYFFETKNFKCVKTLNVRAGIYPVININELEYVKGKIYANIWHENKIAVIDPITGKVAAWIDLSGLLSVEDRKNLGLSVLGYRGADAEKEACLNGIAYDEKNDRLFVTGKLWPKVFEIKIN